MKELVLYWETPTFYAQDGLYDINLQLDINGRAKISVLSDDESIQSSIKEIISNEVIRVFQKVFLECPLSYADIHNPRLTLLVEEEISTKLKMCNIVLNNFEITNIGVTGEEYIKLQESIRNYERRKKDGITWQEERQMMIAEKFTEAETKSHVGNGPTSLNVQKFFKPKTEESSEKPQDNGSKCPKCGADFPENAKFCLSCGEKIQKA